MERLRNQYKSLLYALLGVAITAQFFVVRFLIEPGHLDASSPAAFFATLTGLYASIVLLPLWAFERWAWRIANPRYDISGCWSYTLVYNPATSAAATAALLDGLPLKGRVEVVQTPFVVRMESGAESYQDQDGVNHLASWYSTSADFVSDTRLEFSFEFNVGNRQFRGVERVSIHATGGRPSNMHSQFCFFDSTYRPVAFGEVYYERD